MGEPACSMAQVCEECGRIIESDHADGCPRRHDAAAEGGPRPVNRAAAAAEGGARPDGCGPPDDPGE